MVSETDGIVLLTFIFIDSIFDAKNYGVWKVIKCLRNQKLHTPPRESGGTDFFQVQCFPFLPISTTSTIAFRLMCLFSLSLIRLLSLSHQIRRHRQQTLKTLPKNLVSYICSIINAMHDKTAIFSPPMVTSYGHLHPKSCKAPAHLLQS